MDARFLEEYSKLSDMKAGDIAVSKDRSKFFVCGWENVNKNNVLVTLDITDLCNQYTDLRDASQPVKILKKGDKFIITK